jgi:MFS transporter, putative metabolite:H+ symporter
MSRSACNAGPRLDRLPIGPFHTKVLWLVGLGMFADSFDNQLSGAVLASMLSTHWSTLELNSAFMSATFAGLTIGAALVGWLSDRYGRLFAYQFNLAIFGVMALASAFSPSMEILIACRFIMGIGMGAEYVMGYGLITEFVPPQQRGRYLGLLGLIGGSGVFVTALVSMAVIPIFGWRAMFLIGGVGAIYVWWLRRHLPESPRWLERVGRSEEAEEILQRIEKEAGVPPMAPVASSIVVTERRAIPMSVLFSRAVIRRTALAIFVNVIVLFGSNMLTGWMPTFFVSKGMSVTDSLAFHTAMMAGFIAGPLLCAYIADKLGRRWGLVLFAFLCGAIGALYPFLTSPVAIISCGFLLISAVAVALTLGLGGTPELFPTEYRFRGGGVAQTFGRFGLVCGPFFILTVFNKYGIAGAVGLISGVYILLAIVMAACGIETNQRSLEELDPEHVERDKAMSPGGSQARI